MNDTLKVALCGRQVLAPSTTTPRLSETDRLLTRTFDASFLNAVANHPKVFSSLATAGQTRIELGDWIADPQNHALCSSHGGFVFKAIDPFCFQMFQMFLPSGRGQHADACIAEAAERIFTVSEGVEILAVSPRDADLKPALRQVGFVRDFTRIDCMPRDSGSVTCDFMALRYAEWSKRAPGLVSAGFSFLDELERQRAIISPALPPYGCDKVLARHCGALIKTIGNGGLAAKGTFFFNRFATVAGYRRIEIASSEPLVLDVGGIYVRLGSDPQSFEVIPAPTSWLGGFCTTAPSSGS